MLHLQTRREVSYACKRTHARYQVSIPVQIHGSDSDPSVAQNISENGLSFALPTEIPVGRELITWIYLPGNLGEPPITARCRTVWRSRGSKGYVYGVRYLFFLGNGSPRLKTYLDRLSQPYLD